MPASSPNIPSWQLYADKPDFMLLDGTPLSEVTSDTPLGIKKASGRVIQFTAGDVLTSERTLPSQSPAGVVPSMNGNHVFVSDGQGEVQRFK